MFSPAPGAGLPAPHPALALPRWLHRLDEVSALGNKIHPRARACNPSLRPSRPRSHSCKSRSEDMYASAGSWRCMQPGGGSLAGANFWAVATTRCLIGQCSEQEADYRCFDAPTPTPQCRAEAHAVYLLLNLVMTCLVYAESSSTLLPSPTPRTCSHLSRLARSHECAWACHLYPPTNSAHSSGLTGAR
jgi:hypothetical protein